ncbi:branched-chain amino acid transport system II carrier protein [Clostridium lundense]|uniref:branched-chain amino acid transport system II carrier protein n=1 Tax=Clostridium lundense TaxID=319475 RepID=UPI00048008A6|nr:branched-chain amino acid transport system II carrier protein [Clostridium lundense]
MNKNFKNVLVTGFALFSIFFGAGNLIFPPTLGFISGDKWLWTALGFLLTCISLPLLGIVAVAIVGGRTEDLTNKIGKSFGTILCSIIMLSIGPLFCIPRTGATTFELGVQPLLGNVNPILVSIIYFTITYIFTMNESSVVDKVGSILTPILLIALFTIIFKGIITPLGNPINTGLDKAFSKGFTEGYQTMDALGSIILAQMVIGSLISKGYKTRKDQIDITIKSGIVSAICLGTVYGGLLYIGSTASGVFPKDTTRTELLILITQGLLGDWSKVIFGGAISIACLTTSVGLTATTANYFSKLSNGKISYKSIVLAICIFSCFISNYGVETIIKLAVPVLVTAYPVVIVLIVTNLLCKYINKKGIYTGSVYGALLVSIFGSLSSIGIKISFVENIINKLPLAAQGFSWILPAIIGGVIGALIQSTENRVQGTDSREQNTECR